MATSYTNRTVRLVTNQTQLACHAVSPPGSGTSDVPAGCTTEFQRLGPQAAVGAPKDALAACLKATEFHGDSAIYSHSMGSII